jgi:predicted DNA-binding ArsR family transcriptional regulator
MYTEEQLRNERNKIKRSYESILIDIMFSLVDIEDIIETQSFPIEEIEKKIEELKIKIGRELED